MKNITKIIPIIMIIIITVLTLIYFDFTEAKNYTNFKDYNINTINIQYNSDNELLKNQIKYIQTVAKENNVILLKENADFTKDNASNIYLSLTNEQLTEILIKNFDIKITNSNNNYYATYEKNDINQSGIIKDLFENHYFTYNTIDEMLKNNDNISGNYKILYKDYNDYSSFINEVNNTLGYNTYTGTYETGIENYIIIFMVLIFIFLIIFYFIFQVYEYNNNSKKIACMKILGFDNKTMNKNMMNKKILILIITTIIILLTIIFIKNITIVHILIILLVNLFIIFSTYLISYLSCIIINRSFKLSNILKNQNTTGNIKNISYKFKALMLIILVVFITITLENTTTLLDKLQNYNNSKKLLDYVILPTYNIEPQAANEYLIQHQFYLDIRNNLNTIYAEFKDYSKYTNEELEMTSNTNPFFLIDSIDKNYIIKENIKLYNIDNNEININQINNIAYIFPKSKKHLIDDFKKYHQENLNDYYLKTNENYNLEIYLYDDQLIETYQIEYKYIESPILRIIDDTLNVPIFYHQLGISTFGSGLTTGLKIELIDDDIEKTKQTINEFIKKSDLSSILSRESIMSYKEYFNDEILLSQLIVITLTIGIILVLTVYILITTQLLKMYIKSQNKTILVKKLLGFDNNTIFKYYYNRNLINTVISLIISCIILFIINKFNTIFLFIALIFLILDFLIIYISIKLIKTTNIHIGLKGGNND